MGDVWLTARAYEAAGNSGTRSTAISTQGVVRTTP